MYKLKTYKGEEIAISGKGGSYKELYRIPFGDFVQGTISNSEVTPSISSSMVIMKDAMVMPYDGATLNFVIPDEYKAVVYYGTPYGRTGNTTNASQYSSPQILNGGTFTFPYSEATTYDMEYYYRIAFIKNGITKDEVDGYVENEAIIVYCDLREEDLLSSNAERLGDVFSKAWSITMPSNNNAVVKRYPKIIHISDLHGDAIRYRRCIETAEHIGVSALVNTGDNVPQCAKDGYAWPFALVKDTNLLPIVAQGNHDAVFMTQASFEADFYTSFYNKYGYSRLGAYYYKDDTLNKIRYICLNSCDYTTGDSTSYRVNTISTTQRLWYAQTLLATPSNYKVIVCLHQPLKILTSASMSQYLKFASSRTILSSECVSTGGSEVVDITDAFISGTSITINGTSVNFANKNSGVEFVMYLNGHTHSDNIGYISASNIQLQCNISTGCIDEGIGFTYDYLPHNLGIGKCQDLFNVYVINDDDGIVSVFRIGSDTTVDGLVRDSMDIPYK